MTEHQKQLALIGGTVILAVLLLLLFTKRGGAGSVVNNNGGLPGMVAPTQLGDIIIPGSGPLVIPGLNFGNPDLQIIGSCCMDCANSGIRPDTYNFQSPAIVYNMAAQPEVIVNTVYSTPSYGSMIVGQGAVG